MDHHDEWYHSVFIIEFSKRVGPTKKNLVWLGFWVMFPSLKTQKFEWWMMETENRILVFSVSEIWVMVAKSELCDWVMWPNNNFGVFEIKWGLGWVMGFELRVMSYEYWVIKTESWPNQMSSCFLCEKLLHLYAIGFITECFQIFIFDEVKNFVANNICLSC